MKNLKTLFLAELADIYDAEKRLVKALPKMAKAATCSELKAAFEDHLEETKGHVTKLEEVHVTKLEEVFACFEQKAKGETCEATVGLLKEAEEIAEEFKNSPAINAALIAAAQKVEHYEMATYGCLHEWAEVLGSRKAASVLKKILKEERDANHSLNELARSKYNAEAMSELAGARA